MSHISVLLEESIDALAVKPDGIYVDATLGRGGHSRAILAKLTSGKLYSFDKDQVAIDAIEEDLDNWQIIKADFRDIKMILNQEGITKIDGLLLDIGVSSPQFDDGERGFSYRTDNRLDMRMDQEQSLSAYEVVNTYSEEQLSKVMFEYGEEKYSRRIAYNIVKSREQQPIITTFDLVDIIKASKPDKELRKKGHPAKQVFQALRIEVNQELEALKQVLLDGCTLLNHQGRIAVITFHSLEDRIVKQYFKQMANAREIDHRIPIMPDQIEASEYKVITRKPVLAGDAELAENSRAKSAKLRILERI